jgi:hypothetical protein
MVTVEGLFTSSRRERRLSTALWSMTAQPAADDAARLTPTQLDGRTDAEIAEALVTVYWRPPRVVEPEPVVDHVSAGHDHARPRTDDGGYPMIKSARIHVRWTIEGNAEWLDYWPDGSTTDSDVLVPIDEIYPFPNRDDELQKTNWDRLVELSGNLYLRQGSSITTFVEIARDTEEPQSSRDDQLTERAMTLNRFVEAARDTASAVRPAIVEAITEGVGARRADLAWDTEVRDGLAIGPPNIPGPLELVVPDGGVEGLQLELPAPRLTTPSFVAILNTIEHWAVKVGQYPITFAKLGEDDLSNLLACTLALVFGVTEREVFCVRGRSDLYIPTRALYTLQGLPPPDGSVFIAEAKKNTGPGLAEDAWEDQLREYMPQTTRHSALLFYGNVRNAVAARDRIRDALLRRDDCEEDNDYPEAHYSVVRFDHSGLIASVAIVVINLRSGALEVEAGK